MVLQDYTVSPDNQKIAFFRAEVFANPFYLEIASLSNSRERCYGMEMIPTFLAVNVDFLGNYDFSDSMGQASIVPSRQRNPSRFRVNTISICSPALKPEWL